MTVAVNWIAVSRAYLSAGGAWLGAGSGQECPGFISGDLRLL
jgi:hypothetical protein